MRTTKIKMYAVRHAGGSYLLFDDEIALYHSERAAKQDCDEDRDRVVTILVDAHPPATIKYLAGRITGGGMSYLSTNNNFVSYLAEARRFDTVEYAYSRMRALAPSKDCPVSIVEIEVPGEWGR